jgi:acetolactate synthase I/II/III large subunit
MAEGGTNGGYAIAHALAQNGVTTAFCLAGTAHTFLLQAMDRIGGFNVVSTRHETSSVLAADGYARVTGKPGLALIKNDQGLPNAMTGLCTANAACSPVVVLTSLGPRSSIEAGGEHAGDELDMARGVAKWVRVVPSADRLAEFVHMAVHQARSGRPGVAVLGMPQEFQNFPVAASAMTRPHIAADRFGPSAEALSQLADMIAEAKRPVILTGGGATASGAEAELRELANNFRIPVIGNSLGRGLVPEDNELGFSWPLAQVAAKEADLVIAAGIRMTQRLGYGLPPRFSKSAKFVQIDTHAEEFGRNRPVDLPIHADVGVTFARLLSELNRRFYRGSDTGWVGEAMRARQARIAEIGQEPGGEIHPYRIGRALQKLLPDDAVLVGDGADILNWLHGVYFVKHPRSYMDHYPFGSMGVGTALALGAAVGLREEAAAAGTPERPLVLLTGDGAFGFYCGELHSFAKGGLRISVIIANDGAWGTEHHGQLRALGTSYNCLLGKSDYEHVGTAFGFASRKVTAPDEVDGAIRWSLENSGSTLLNILTDTEAGKLRKSDPRVQTVAFEDLASSLKAHHTPDVA